jgi:hypothetical protein
MEKKPSTEGTCGFTLKVQKMAEGDVAALVEAIVERIVERIERKQRVVPPDLSRREAARYMGVSVDTLTKFQRQGLLRYRNASPPGSGKPKYLYPVEDLDQLIRQGYRQDLPLPAKAPAPSGRLKPKRPQPQKYEHLDLD